MDRNATSFHCDNRIARAYNEVMKRQAITAKQVQVWLRDLIYGGSGGGEAGLPTFLGEWTESRERVMVVVERKLEDARRVAAPRFPAPMHGGAAHPLVALARDFSAAVASLEAWSAVYHRYFLPTAFSVSELANAAHVDVRQFDRRLSLGYQLLATELQLESNREHVAAAQASRRFCVPCLDQVRLFGIAPLLEDLAGLLLDPVGPAIVALHGMGGIGKTTLAGAFACECGRTAFAGVAWISAQRQQLLLTGEWREAEDQPLIYDELLSGLALQLGRPDLVAMTLAAREDALKRVLKARSHLVVIDNVEGASSAHDLAERLPSLANPSRFLLTGRRSLHGYPFIQSLEVPPLSRADSCALLRSELQRHTRRSGSVDDQTLEEVFRLVGGLPLALKLLAGQLAQLPLGHVLRNLERAGGQAARHLYDYVYRESWNALDDAARRLLVSMLLIAPTGADCEYLAQISGLTDDALDDALTELADLALAQVSGPVETPLYSLHPFTATFLRAQVVRKLT